ncbi:MAG: HEAT repeat domain-containing protein [Gemmataceae bacterium]|nr:HEAT repeat domain-containing protein [Gemmataceae bacterium]
MFSNPTRSLLGLLVLSLSGACGAARADALDEDPDVTLLREARVPRGAAGLLDFLARRSGGEADLKDLQRLVRQLGHARFGERERAAEKLVGLGPAALGALRRAFDDPDKEIARRARECVQKIVQEWDPALTGAAVRHLLRLRPDGIIPALVRYVPYATESDTEEEVWFGLDSLTEREGKPHPALLKALQDPVPARRAAAACLVGRRGDSAQREAIRKLLDDADAVVRLRAAQGLLGAGEKAAIPTLVALLSDDSAEVRWQAEEMLRWAAGDGAPGIMVGAGTARERQKCRDAWKAWWQDHGPKLDLAKRERDYRRPGLVLLCDRGNPSKSDGRVWLTGCDGTTRWELTGLSSPSDARLLAGGRVLIAESGAGVSERRLDGTVRWRYQGLKAPSVCQPLPSGNTFVAEPSGRMAEVGPAGEEVSLSRIPRCEDGLHTYARPQRLPTGRLLCRLLQASRLRGLIELEPDKGHVLKSVRFLGFIDVPEAANLEAVPEAGYLVAGATGVYRGYVLEVDPTGRVARKSLAHGASHAIRLPSGNTLACGIGRLVEVDRDGTVVWEAFFSTDFQRLHACLGLVRLGFDRAQRGGKPVAVAPPPLSGLSSPDRLVRRRTIAFLAEFGPGIPEAVPALKILSGEGDPTIREEAKNALAVIEASPLLGHLKRLKDKGPRVRAEAAWGGGGHSWAVRVVAPALIKVAEDPDAKVRWMAANVLGSMDVEAEQVVPALIKAARDTDVEVQKMAVHSLGRMGRKAAPAVSVLIECLLKSEDVTVRYWSGAALGFIGPVDKRVVPVLTEALKASRTRVGAASGLSLIGPEAVSAVPALLAVFDAPLGNFPPHVPDELRSIILAAFGRMGPGARATVPMMIRVLRDKERSPAVREAAVKSLGALGPVAAEAIPALKEVADDLNEVQLRKAAFESLQKIQGDSRDR